MSTAKITSFFSKVGGQVGKTTDIVKAVLNSIIDNVVDSCEKKKRKHTGGQVTESTRRMWTDKFPWLVIEIQDESHTKLFCKTCKAEKKTNAMATCGSPDVQISALQKHDRSIEHADAMKISLLKRARSSRTQTGNASSDTDTFSDTETGSDLDNISQTDSVVFKTVYYCAKEGISTEKVNSLLELQKMNGAKCEYQHLSWDTISDIQESISVVLTRDLLNRVKESNFFAIMIDESQDVAVHKRLVICIRYVNNAGCVATEYLCSMRVDDGKAHTITKHIYDTLSDYKLDMTKLVSLGSDGAAVMMGKKTGVGVQIRAKFSPYMVHSHCIAHRLALACSDSLAGVPVLETFRSRFNALFHLFHNSAIKTTKLEKIEEFLKDPILKVVEPHTIRWLSISKAVNAVYMCYPSIVVSLSEIGETDPSAKGLHKYFVQAKTALLTGFMNDVHTKLAVLSSELQKRDLLFSEVKPLFEGTLSGIKELKKGGEKFREIEGAMGEEQSLKGVNLDNLNTKQRSDLSSTMAKYVDKLCENMENRLREPSDTLANFGRILEPNTFAISEDEADTAINKLGDFYGKESVTKVYENEAMKETKVKPLLEKTGLLNEWAMFKGMLKGSYKDVNTKELCRRIMLMHSNLLPNICKLSEIGLCLCLTSVECERSFSTQNLIKTRLRSSIKTEKLDCLIRICLVGPHLGEYSVTTLTRAVKHWHSVKSRRLGRLRQPYKPRGPRPKKAKVASFANV